MINLLFGSYSAFITAPATSRARTFDPAICKPAAPPVGKAGVGVVGAVVTLEAVALVWTLEIEVGVAVVGAAVTVGVVALVWAWEIEVGLLTTVETGSLVVVDAGRLVEAGMLSVGLWET